ncbi:MAG TPA: hypothetical protein VM166_07010 [Gemmatimonadaceae bacterium]|nr:hypothetical protein [Gemmatimonadaceae bacterium]
MQQILDAKRFMFVRLQAELNPPSGRESWFAGLVAIAEHSRAIIHASIEVATFAALVDTHLVLTAAAFKAGMAFEAFAPVARRCRTRAQRQKKHRQNALCHKEKGVAPAIRFMPVRPREQPRRQGNEMGKPESRQCKRHRPDQISEVRRRN